MTVNSRFLGCSTVLVMFHILVDIYIPALNLCVYVDGIYWHHFPDRKIRDKQTNRILKKLGYYIIRFSDKEVLEDVDACVNSILDL